MENEMTTEKAIDWIYESVAKEYGISVNEVKQRAVAGERLVSKFSEGKH